LRGHFPDLDIKVPKPLNRKFEPNPSTFGAKLRNKRLELNISHKNFGKLLGVSEVTVIHWENNKVKPRVKNYPKLLEFIEFTLFKN
jgi:DNA-binding transcriptional regulator YiaG